MKKKYERKTMLYKLTRGTMQPDTAKKPPLHLRYGFGLLDVGGVVVADCALEGITKIRLQRAIHNYAQATGKQFKTRASVTSANCVTIKRIK